MQYVSLSTFHHTFWRPVACLLPVLLICAACRREEPAAAPTPEVATIILKSQPLLLRTELPGRTSAYRVAEIRPQVNGLIQKRLFTEGAEVRAGEQLYQIDPAPFQAALDNAKAALDRAEANLPAIRSKAQRYQEALADKSVSQQDFDDANAARKQAEADIEYYRALTETARINLDYTRVLSPISGRIGTSSVTEGAIVTAYQPTALATLQQLDPIYVDVTQSTTELLRLQRQWRNGQMKRDGTNGDQVELLLEDGSTYALKGTLQFRDVSVDPTTATVILRMVFANPEGVLLPGMFVRTLVEEGVNQQAILIPQQAVSRNPKGEPLAMTVDAAGKAEQRSLQLDRAVGNQWLVTSGLAAGDRLIVEGMQNVKPGQPVKVVAFEEGGQPQTAANSAAQPAGTQH